MSSQVKNTLTKKKKEYKMKIFLIILLTSFIMSFNVQAKPLINVNGDMIKNQVLSVINNKQNTWTPTDFAIARGDSVSSIPKIRIVKDVITKSGIKLPNILNQILIWSR